MRIVRIVVLAAIWVALWGEVSVANITFGVIVAVVASLAFPTLDDVNGNRIRPIAAARLSARSPSTWCDRPGPS